MRKPGASPTKTLPGIDESHDDQGLTSPTEKVSSVSSPPSHKARAPNAPVVKARAPAPPVLPRAPVAHQTTPTSEVPYTVVYDNSPLPALISSQSAQVVDLKELWCQV
jgi:hypothetical protein